MSVEDGLVAHDDGLIAPEVGAWAEAKHRLVSLYATLVCVGNESQVVKASIRGAICESGYSKIRNTSKFIFGSPLLGLQLKDPFDKYVFCEEKPKAARRAKNSGSPSCS